METGERMITLSIADLESMFTRVIASQQPFFQGMLTQISGMDSRMAEMTKQLNANTRAVELVDAAEIQLKLRELEKRIDDLDTESLKRKGVIEMFEWAPKFLVWLAAIIGVIWMYFDLKAKGGHP